MNNLINELQVFYNEDPSDPFNIYGLAIEYLKSDWVKSRKYFEELLLNHEDYIATYYHAAALYLQINELELAEKTYLKGIEIAKRLGKAHALNELKRAYQSYLEEEFE
ncbi:MAG: tetratricopeptide repeat protein [Bacteroidota bacterium]